MNYLGQPEVVFDLKKLLVNSWTKALGINAFYPRLKGWGNWLLYLSILIINASGFSQTNII